jgi:DNA-binding transcriptional ArsR family regulator/DNA-binding PadR family transcriptional regulator
MLLAKGTHFVRYQIMDANLSADAAVSRIAIAIGEPARTRMLLALLDGHARTSTELAVLAEVTASTASVHLNRLKEDNLVKVAAQGRHRYYSLQSAKVARALEGLSVLAGRERKQFKPKTPEPLRYARTCYDHIAGTLSVLLHDHLLRHGWLRSDLQSDRAAYILTSEGEKKFERVRVDLGTARTARRKFAYPCLDWSERRPHIAGVLGAALLQHALTRKWITRDLDSRALHVTRIGEREMLQDFGFQCDDRRIR